MMSSEYWIEIIKILHVSFVQIQYYAALMMASIIIYMYALYIICTGKGIKQF